MGKLNVKEIRLGLGLTQEGLARKLGVSFATVSNWERKITKPCNLAVAKLKELTKELPAKITEEVIAPAPSENPGRVKAIIDQFADALARNPGYRYGTMTEDELPDGKVKYIIELTLEQ